MSEGFYLERRLKETAPELHRRVKDCGVVLETMLDSTLKRFPQFTDHTLIHSLIVLEKCDNLIGEKQVQQLSPEEIYVLIMGCYLHDLGMGISDQDYEELSAGIDFADYFRTHDRRDITKTIREFHNDFSGLLVRKYSRLFDIPSEELTEAIVQVVRGHRKNDLFNEEEYNDIRTEGGVIRTAYLAAVLRLTDETDVASDRTPELLYDSSLITDENCIIAYGSHASIKRVEQRDDAILLHTRPKSAEYIPIIEDLAQKIQDTLDYCRRVVKKRSNLDFRPHRVLIVPWKGPESEKPKR